MPASPCSTASGAILVATDGRVLPLRSSSLRARAGGGLARVVLQQQFVNPHAEPLHVTYLVPLPADGAVTGYRFRIGEREIVGTIDRRKDARERFVQAVMDGRTAALLEQDRSSVFTQELGNIPPGASLEIEIEIEQPLVWMAERGGSWEWRFPTVVAPRYMGATDRVPDAARITTHASLDHLHVAVGLHLTIDDAQHGIECASHIVQTTAAGASTQVTLAESTATLDRDVVVRWVVAGEHAATTAQRARPVRDHAHADDAFALLAIVPPRVSPTHVPRDLIVLLDTSGSMAGAPLDQARRLASALVDQLDERDQIELIEFSTTARQWQPGPVFATRDHRAAAKQWLGALSARGGTEMRTGIRAALAALRPEAQRQIVLVTDGQIGFESEIVAEIHNALPTGCRVHTVGVGSAVNRSLTAPAARAGRGVEIVVGIDEDPERAIARLCAHTRAPQIVDLVIDGDAVLEHAPMHLPDLMAEHPATIAVRVRAQGGTLRIRGRGASGAWEQRLLLPPTAAGEGNPAVITRFGRERVEDLELRAAAGESGLDPQIEHLGLSFAIATRMTSWIAIDNTATIDPTAPTRHEVMPHALAHGVSASGIGLPPAPMAVAHAASGAVDGASDERVSVRSIGPLPPLAPRQRVTSPAPQAAGRPPPSPPPVPEASRRAKPKVVAPSTRDEGAATAGRAAESSAPPPALGFADAESSDDLAEPAVTGTHVEVRGRFVRLADATLVIEFTVTAALAWALPATIELHFEDGSTVTATVDRTRSTRAGDLQPGMQAKLVCPGVRAGNVTMATAAYSILLVVRA